ncbi:MAG: hypothetical protein PHW33_04210 [Candidatus Portnoybacteria bacterium]|nr:hypothetical protein [Candidatus Portnoybacteria bacterium]
MNTKNRSSGDDSPVRQLFQLCSLCGKPILAGGTSYKYEKDSGCHWACLKQETRRDLILSVLHEMCLDAFSILFTGYPQERRLVLNIFEAWLKNQTIPSGLECLHQALDLAESCRFGGGTVMVEKIGCMKEEIEALAAAA